MGNIIYSRQQIITGSGSIVGTTFQGEKSTDFISTPNSSYQIAESCKMTLHSDPTVGDKVAFWLTSTANFDITAPDKIKGFVLANGVFKRVTKLYTIIVLTYSGSTNGWEWDDRDNNNIRTWTPFSDNTILYIKGNGANNSTNIVDESIDDRTITVTGNTKISTVQSKYGGSSIYFDGSGGALTIPSSGVFTAGDFTWEALVYPTYLLPTTYGIAFMGTGTGGAGGDAGMILQVNSSGNPKIMKWVNQTGATHQTLMVNNTWHHVAATRSGTVCDVWLNGVKCTTSGIASASIFATPLFTIGTAQNSGVYNRHFTGYMSHIRCANSVLYTTNFNPETGTWLV